MRIALIHDWANQRGGAEGVLETLVDLFPGSPVYTSIYWPEKMPAIWQTWDIRTSWLNRLPGVKRNHQPFLPLYPLAFESFDLSGYDVVLSNKSGFCHGVITGPDTLHICYCLTPTRYLWMFDTYSERESLGRWTKVGLQPMLLRLRQWDRLAADRVDHFLAISTEVQRRIAKFYRRESTVIYPPVATGRFQPVARPDGYYLLVSRLIPYKRVDLAIQAFTRLGLPLLVAGEGRDRAKLEAMAGKNVTFLGRVPDSDLPDLVARCRAFVFPGNEDFGIAPLEALAAGRPVIAFNAGGALDTLVDGKTGVMFSEQSVDSLAAAVQSFEPERFDPAALRTHAQQFDIDIFRAQIKAFVTARWHEFHRKTAFRLLPRTK
jgi:glycosyltransferase involved in cell wall biosynthesis